MLRVVLFIIFFYVFVGAKSFKENENLEIIAKNIAMENNIITATGNVIVYSPTKYMTAAKLIYDRNKSTIELFDNVIVVQDGETTNYSEYLFLDTKKDLKLLKPSLFLEDSGKLWLNSQQIDAKDAVYGFENSILSSCDCIDPAWNLSFTSGDYDTKKKWINTYNTTMFIKGVPILYTPYFGFSTNNTRRTGLLPPTVGYSNDEGFLYAQPFYYAPTIDFDLEFIPQIRYLRGYGYEMKLRYADSPFSKLNIEFGAFYEKEAYYKEEKLKNKKHNGWDIRYNRSKLFSTNEHKDGLKINILDMNDVDYENTKYSNTTSGLSDKTLNSEIKYYYTTNDYYGDIEFEKLKDLSKDNDYTTLQTLPKINLHKYSNSLLKDITYSLDVNYHRQRRHQGLSANTTDITIPITYTKSILDDYLEFSLGEELNFLHIDYEKNNPGFVDGKYITLTHFGKIQTNLIKPYKDHLHTINLSATFKKPESIHNTGDLYSITSNNSELSPFPITESNETFVLSLNSSLYEKDTLSQLINYKITQLYTYNKSNKTYDKDDLSQNLRLSFGNFELNNDLFYSHDLNKIVSSSTTLNYTYDQINFQTYYKHNKDKITLDNQESLVYTIGVNFDKNYSLSYSQEIDLNSDITRRKEYKFGIDKKCWALNLKYTDSAIASATIDNSVDRQDIIYLEFNFKNLYKLNHQYKSN